MKRRQFLVAGGAAAAAFSLFPSHVRGSPRAAKVRLGLIGCGGRGTWIAGLFHEHGGYTISAAADYFEDRVTQLGDKFQVPHNRRFTGLDAYRRVLDAGVDAIAVISPPYFHPEHAAAGVAARVHVYLAKPVAVDVPGCNLIAESGRQATAHQRCFLVDFQTRVDPLFVEALRRVHRGALGGFAFGEASYHAGDPFTSKYHYLQADPKNPENQLRAWGLSRALSGDIITEQNIHALDVMSWIMDQAPVAAAGTGGRKVRTLGSCYDTFTLAYEYPNQIGVTFSSRQFFGHRATGGIRNRMFGSDGVLETEYGGQVRILSDDPFPGGRTAHIYREGAVRNIAQFHRDITAGSYENPTVAPSVRSTLVTILGRTAAYEHRRVAWTEVVQSSQRMQPNLDGLKA